MDSQDLGAGFGARDRCVPLEAGEIVPNVGVFLLRVGQLRQQATLAEFGELEMAGRASAPAAGLRIVEDDRI